MILSLVFILYQLEDVIGTDDCLVLIEEKKICDSTCAGHCMADRTTGPQFL